MPSKPNTKLTEGVILLAAQARRNGAVFPLPGKCNAPTTTTNALLGRMLTIGLIEERPAKVANGAWRSEENGAH